MKKLTENAVFLVKSCPEQAYLDNQAHYNRLRMAKWKARKLSRESEEWIAQGPYNTFKSACEASAFRVSYVIKLDRAKQFMAEHNIKLRCFR